MSNVLAISTWSEWEAVLSGGEVLKVRQHLGGRGRVVVVRVGHYGNSYIVKCWRRDFFRALVSKLLGCGTGRRECMASRRMSSLSCVFPKVVHYDEVNSGLFAYYEILVFEDLGVCEPASTYLKRMLLAGDDRALDAEDEIINQTKLMIDNGMIDIDHRLCNFIVNAEGRPVRVDFEHCKKYRKLHICNTSFSKMLGTLIGSHVFASQPHTELTQDFCNRLFSRLNIDNCIINDSICVVDDMLERQRLSSGISIEFSYRYG